MNIIDRLRSYCPGAVPMHMPGHKRNTGLSGEKGYLEKLAADIDITEIDGFDNLNDPDGIIKESEQRASELWKSGETFYTVNGSTSGILSALFACTVKNKKILAARNCHKSVYNSIRIFGLEPVFIMPQTDEITGACGRISPESVREILERDPEIKTVIITSPTYEGLISDIRQIAQIVHSFGAVLITDEAHGAHLGLYGVFPEDALSCGADIVIQSLHKTLPSLTATACVHLGKAFAETPQAEEFRRAMPMFSTSSPSYLLISSMDSCTALLCDRGKEILSSWMEELKRFYSRVNGLKHISVRDPFKDKATDPSKIIISGMSGGRLADILRDQYNIEPEMAAPGYVIAMTGAGDTRETLDALADALIDTDLHMTMNEIFDDIVFPGIPVKDITVSQAYLSETENISLTDAAGRTSAGYIWAYPPGIPVIVPGEIFSAEIIDYINKASASGIPLHSDRTNGISEVSVIKR